MPLPDVDHSARPRVPQSAVNVLAADSGAAVVWLDVFLAHALDAYKGWLHEDGELHVDDGCNSTGANAAAAAVVVVAAAVAVDVVVVVVVVAAAAAVDDAVAAAEGNCRMLAEGGDLPGKAAVEHWPAEVAAYQQ